MKQTKDNNKTHHIRAITHHKNKEQTKNSQQNMSPKTRASKKTKQTPQGASLDSFLDTLLNSTHLPAKPAPTAPTASPAKPSLKMAKRLRKAVAADALLGERWWSGVGLGVFFFLFFWKGGF